MGEWLASPWFWPAILGGGSAAIAIAALVFLSPVYKHIVCLKYLFGGWKAVVPLISALPAALGVFLLILVFAIMDGFVQDTSSAIRGTLSDIIVDGSMGGLPHYDDFIERLEQIEGVEAATPVIQTLGVIRIKPRFAEVQPLVRWCTLLGIRPAGKAKMGRFGEYLYYPRVMGLGDEAFPADVPPGEVFTVPESVRQARERRGKTDRPACVGGIALVSGGLVREVEKEVPEAMGLRVALWVATGLSLLVLLFVLCAALRPPRRSGRLVALGICVVVAVGLAATTASFHVRYAGVAKTVLETRVREVPLVDHLSDLVVTTVPVRRSGALETAPGSVPKAVTRAFVPLYVFRSRFYESDSRHLYVDFEVAQEMAGMAANPSENTPARASQIQVKIADPAKSEQIKRAIEDTWYTFIAGREEQFPPVDIGTWKTSVGPLLKVVEMERNITVLMIGAMFIGFGVLTALISYVLAYIRTRDVGVLKALGASDVGVGSLFLGYGFIIGLIGTALGLAGALLMLHYLDPIEAYVNHLRGGQVFPREVYYFDQIPRNLSATWATSVCLAVLALSTLASMAGGLLAALKQPVEALRYE